MTDLVSGKIVDEQNGDDFAKKTTAVYRSFVFIDHNVRYPAKAYKYHMTRTYVRSPYTMS